jgi:aspartate kinase
MKVLKFGGTSLATPQRMKNIATLVKDHDGVKWVVLSAVSGTTNKLQALCDSLFAGDRDKAALLVQNLYHEYLDYIDELISTEAGVDQARELLDDNFNLLRVLVNIPFVDPLMKVILAQGELISTRLFDLYLTQEKVEHKLVSALELMRIDENGEPDLEYIDSSVKQFSSDSTQLFVTQGYICTNPKGEIDNLKRGGSDYTASLLGEALNASEIQIWTDIDGMHNNDPREVDKTFPISELNFDEAAELAYFGAKILHPQSIFPAQRKSIPVRILNTMDPTAPGTVVKSKSGATGIKSIAVKDGIIAIKIKSGRMLMAYGFLRKVFEVFEKYQTSIDVITTSEVAVSLTVDNDERLSDILTDLQEFGIVTVDRDLSIISVVGSLISEQKGMARKVFDALEEVDVRMISFGGSKNNISIVIDTDQKKKALAELNDQLFVDHWK